jgi:biotin-(acetyl-CoA carboxylase) ligase
MGVPLTIILPSDSHSAEQVALRAGLAACIACERMLIRLGCRKRLGLRWPNDVVVDTGKAGQRIGRKLSGVLIETAALATAERVLLVGIGINVLQKSADWPTALQKKATSLADVAGCHAGDEALSQTVQQLLRAMAQVWTLTDSEIVAMWQPRSLLQGTWAIFDCATPTGLERVEGLVDAIDPLLRVTVKTTTGSRQLIASRTTLRHDLM